MRIVIKVGTQVISTQKGLNKMRIREIVGEIAALIKKGHEVILVSSGAIGAGLPLIHFASPLRKKVAAAVGQSLLMHNYINAIKKHKIIVGQILISSDDFTNQKHFKNFVLNIEAMLSHKILPIINENDVMKREDLRVNDNDTLAAMVAVGLKADKFIILTNQNGLYDKNPDHHADARLIKEVPHINSEILAVCDVGKSDLGVGGMCAKVSAAQYSTKGGVETFIGTGDKKGTITGALSANFPGTRFIAKKKKKHTK
jgi:glutamate 5-kinase